MIEPDIGKDGTGTKVGPIAEDGITDIIEVWDLRLVKDEAILELTGIAQNHAVPHDDIFTDVGPIANLTSLADPGRSLDHGSMLDHRAAPDEDGTADEGLADEFAVDAGFETKLKVGADLGQGFPGMGDIVEDEPVLGMAEIEQ